MKFTIEKVMNYGLWADILEIVRYYGHERVKGISYLINEDGERTAVVIDWKTYGEELEDFLEYI